VNIPQFRLFAFRSTADLKADILQMDVIVGRTYAGMQTPVFAADMRYVIFRPYWDVPRTIARKDLLPAMRRSPLYSSTQHLEIVDGSDDSAPLPPTAENLAAVEAGRLRLRQQPGADNSLGPIRVMILYGTALATESGETLFFEDIYGHDRKLEVLLRAVSTRAAVAPASRTAF